MIVVLRDSGDHDVLDADNLNELACQLNGPVDVTLAAGRSSGAITSAEEDHVWLSLAWLRRTAQDTTHSPAWLDRFQSMVAFAESHGWCSEDGSSVRAHVLTR